MAPENGLTLRFVVTLDDRQSLGKWTKCEGLSIEYEVHEYAEGGENGFTHRLPGRRKYQPIRLTRPLDEDSGEVAAMVSAAGEPGERHTAEIKVLDAQGLEVTSWALNGVFVSKWSGPSLDVNGRDIAFETLELVHNGFLNGS